MNSKHSINAGLSRVLIMGVWAAALLCIAGLVFAAARGEAHPPFKPFTPVSGLASPGSIFTKALALDARGLMALGVLALIATPVIRVAFSLVAFVLERDRVYAAVTVLVLALLAVGLFAGLGE